MEEKGNVRERGRQTGLVIDACDVVSCSSLTNVLDWGRGFDLDCGPYVNFCSSGCDSLCKRDDDIAY